MHIGQEEHRVAFLVLLLKHEIVYLFLFCRQIQRLPESGTQAVQAAGNTTAGSNQEHGTTLLGGIDGITAEGVRKHYGHSVRNRHASYRPAVADDPTVDISRHRAHRASEETK